MKAYEVFKTREINTENGRETINESVGIFEKPEDAYMFVEKHPGTFVHERTLILISEFDANDDLGVSSRTWDSKNSVSELTIEEIADIKREYNMDPHDFFETRKLARELEESLGYENFSDSKLFFDIARLDSIASCRALGYDEAKSIVSESSSSYEIMFESGRGVIINKIHGEIYEHPSNPEDYDTNKGKLIAYEVIPFEVVDGEKIFEERRFPFSPDYSESHKVMVDFIESVSTGEYFVKREIMDTTIIEACSHFEEISLKDTLEKAEHFELKGDSLDIDFRMGLSATLSRNIIETENGTTSEYQLRTFSRLEDGTKQEIPNLCFDFRFGDGPLDESMNRVFQNPWYLGTLLHSLEDINSASLTYDEETNFARGFPLSIHRIYNEVIAIREQELENTKEKSANNNDEVHNELRNSLGYQNIDVESALQHLSSKDDIVAISYGEDSQSHGVVNIYFENGVSISITQQFDSNIFDDTSRPLYEISAFVIDTDGKEITLETIQVSKQDIETGTFSEYIDKVSSEEYRAEIDEKHELAKESNQNDDDLDDGFGV